MVSKIKFQCSGDLQKVVCMYKELFVSYLMGDGSVKINMMWWESLLGAFGQTDGGERGPLVAVLKGPVAAPILMC